MTFASEAVRTAFHQLPTQTQVEYTEMENRFADQGRSLHIEAVIQHSERCLEVIVRIAEQFKTAALTRTNRTVAD